MKKFIIFILCFVLLISAVLVPEPIEVHAEENAAKEYYIEFLASSDFNKGSNKYQGYSGRMEFTLDKNIAMYCEMGSDTISVRTLILNSDGSYLEINDFLSNISKNVSGKKNFWYKKGSYEFFGGRSYEYYSLSEEKEGYINGRLYWKTATIEESGYLASNIPIFSDIASAKSYLEGNLSVKDAINYETDLCDIKYDLEVPQNMQLSLKENLFTLPIYTMTWEQTDPNYKNWTTEVYIYVSVDAWEGALGIHLWGDTYTYEDLFFMAESISTYKLKYVIDTDSDKYEKADEKIMDYVFNDNHKLSGMATDYYKVYMRNAYYDGEYRHYSNWLLVEFDYEFESGQGQTSIIEMGGNVKDNPGSSNPSDDFIGGVVDDSQYDGSVDANLSESSSDILGWIKTGFGIGGDNGVIAMLSDAFDFIPSEIWSVMIAGISLMVAVAVFKFIRG